MDVLLAAAVPAETTGLRALLEDVSSRQWLQGSILEGRYRSLSVALATTGIGKVNAAIMITALLSRFTPKRVCYFGCAGAYPDSPLAVGDVLVIDEVVFADEGVLTASGPLPMTEVGIPLLYHRHQSIFERFAFGGDDLICSVKNVFPPGRYTRFEAVANEQDDDTLRWERIEPCRERSTHSSGRSFGLGFGPTVSVGMASGDRETALWRYRQYRGWAEDMESSGVTQACVRLAVPMLLFRGISNVAGDRDKRNWRMDRAVKNCQAVVRGCLDSWAEEATRCSH